MAAPKKAAAENKNLKPISYWNKKARIVDSLGVFLKPDKNDRLKFAIRRFYQDFEEATEPISKKLQKEFQKDMELEMVKTGVEKDGELKMQNDKYSTDMANGQKRVTEIHKLKDKFEEKYESSLIDFNPVLFTVEEIFSALTPADIEFYEVELKGVLIK